MRGERFPIRLRTAESYETKRKRKQAVRMHGSAARLILLLGLFALSAKGAYAGGSSGNPAPCNIVSPIDAGVEGNLNRGDRLFRRRDYRLAAVAYYRVSFCGSNSILVPAVFDQPGIVEGCKAALILASRGRYLDAANRLRRLNQQLPRFTEAGYLAGNFFWAADKRESAKEMWRQTVQEPEFALPEDQQDQSKTSAKQMLEWSKR